MFVFQDFEKILIFQNLPFALYLAIYDIYTKSDVSVKETT
jgi:hypothetical protein